MATHGGSDPATQFDVRTNLRAVLSDLKAFDPKLATALRRELRHAGDEAIKRMGEILDEYPSTSEGSMRATIKKGLKLRITTSEKNTNVRLASTAGALRKALNKKSFRHPTFGHDPWVDQAGATGDGDSKSGYFNQAIGAKGLELRAAVEAIIRNGLEEVARKAATHPATEEL